MSKIKGGYSPEKVRDLANYIGNPNLTHDEIEVKLTKWLKQNQPDPVVVGLSGEQVILLSRAIRGMQMGTNRLTHEEVIEQFLIAQEFTLPEDLEDELAQ